MVVEGGFLNGKCSLCMDSVKSESAAADKPKGVVDGKRGIVWKIGSEVGIDKEEYASGWIKKDKNKLVNLT